MKAITPVCAAKRCSIGANDFFVPPLCGRPAFGENGMSIADLPNDFGLVDAVDVVKRDEEDIA